MGRPCEGESICIASSGVHSSIGPPSGASSDGLKSFVPAETEGFFLRASFAAAVRLFFGLRPPGRAKRIVTSRACI